MSTAIDVNSMPIVSQFDPDRPVTRLEALRDGEEQPAIKLVDWLASEEQRERLYHMIIDRLDDDDIAAAAEQWAKEAEG